MKKLTYLIMIAFMAFSFSSCEEGVEKPNDKDTPMLTIHDTSISIDSEEGASTTVDIESNTSWSASSNAEWCTISPNEGSGNKTITISATKNIGDERVAIVTVSVSEEIKKTITITQRENISVSKPIRLGNILISDRNVGAQADGVALNYTNDSSHPDHKNSGFKGGYYNWDEARTICPDEWRLPTKEELEFISNSMQFSEEGAYIAGDDGNICYFPVSGYLDNPRNKSGYYWSSVQDGGPDSFGKTYAWHMYVNVISGLHTEYSSAGLSVRCVKTVSTP